MTILEDGLHRAYLKDLLSNAEVESALEELAALRRDAERYRGIRAASMDARDGVRSELDHYAACHLPHYVVDTIEKFDANTDDLIDAYKRIGARG